MHALYDLKEKLIEELEEIRKKPKLDKSSLELTDMLAHATKNLCKVIEACEEEEYSKRMSRRSYDDGMRRSYDDGMSGQPRDGRGRYDVERGRAWGFSGDDDTVKKLEKLAERSDESTRRAINQAIQMMRG